jgi:hypothetical protein
MGVRDLLERVRPSGTPGAPSVAGVPADVVAERTTELQAVFAALEPTQAEVRRIGQEAAGEAARRRQAAARRAETIIADARSNEAGERARAAAEACSGAADDAAAIVAAAEQEAATLLAAGRHAAPRRAQRVRERAREELLGLAQEMT